MLEPWRPWETKDLILTIFLWTRRSNLSRVRMTIPIWDNNMTKRQKRSSKMWRYLPPLLQSWWLTPLTGNILYTICRRHRIRTLPNLRRSTSLSRCTWVVQWNRARPLAHPLRKTGSRINLVAPTRALTITRHRVLLSSSDRLIEIFRIRSVSLINKTWRWTWFPTTIRMRRNLNFNPRICSWTSPTTLDRTSGALLKERTWR